jgi:hypothetical protein
MGVVMYTNRKCQLCDSLEEVVEIDGKTIHTCTKCGSVLKYDSTIAAVIPDMEKPAVDTLVKVAQLNRPTALKHFTDMVELHYAQIKFQQRVTPANRDMAEHIRLNTLSMVDEAMEQLRETPWKPWKKQQQLNLDEWREELVDVFIFLINLANTAGMPIWTLISEAYRKVKKNNDRQDNGY